MTDPITRTEDAQKVLQDILESVDSDLLKAHYFLDKGMKVAIVLEDIPTATKIARYTLELESLTKRLSTLRRKLS